MQLRLIHTTCEKLFPYKYKQPELQQFNVIYQLKCDCGASNIGQSDRIITRLNHHNIDSPLQQETDVAKHQVDNPTHKINFDNSAIFIGENVS